MLPPTTTTSTKTGILVYRLYIEAPNATPEDVGIPVLQCSIAASAANAARLPQASVLVWHSAARPQSPSLNTVPRET